MSQSSPNEESGPAAAAGGGEIDLRAWLRALLKFWWLIVLATGLVGGGVLLWTMQQPRIYQAQCTLEYDPHPSTPLGSDVDDVSSPLGSFWMNREFFQTQNRVISSRIVSARVVADLHLYESPNFFNVPEDEQERWVASPDLRQKEAERGRLVARYGADDTRVHQVDEEIAEIRQPLIDSAARLLQGRLTVEEVPDTRLVRLLIRDRDPDRAASLANAVAEAYIQKTIEDRLGSAQSAVEFLHERLESLQTRLDGSERALHTFREDHNVLSVSMEDRQNLLANEIQHFSEALTKVRTRRIELQARHGRVSHSARADSAEDAASEFPENEAINVLRQELRQKLAEREGLATRYGPNHLQMQAIDGEITDLRRQLQHEVDGVVRAAAADVREIRSIESGLRSQLDTAHTAGIELGLREIEFSGLDRHRENDAKLLDLVLERATETDLTNEMNRVFRTTHARILDRALAPATPISPNKTANALGGTAAGLALGIAFAFLLSRLDRRLESVADVEAMGLTILGILPKITEGEDAQPMYARGKKRRRRSPPKKGDNRDLYVHTHPMSATAECCRTIRTNLTFMSADDPIRSMVVTSPSPREGKTTVTTNIAISLAQSGKRVLMIDTDLRRPRIHRAFGVSGARGITSVIVGEENLDDVIVPTDVPNLDVLPCGPIPPNPSELFHSQGFHDLVEEALTKYDRLIFDSPPLGAVTDAAVLAPQLDAAMLVVKARETTRDALRSALRQLRDVNANVVGGVLNDVDGARRGYASSDYYYRREGYYYAEEEEEHSRDADGPSAGGASAPPPA